MDGEKFKAVSIVVKDQGGRTSLVEAFNSWSERVRPAVVVHVHYFHDASARVRGYQVIYQESAVSDGARVPVKGNGHDADAVSEADA